MSVLLFFLAHFINAQSLSPSTLGTAGASATGGGVQLQSTTGPGFIPTLVQPSNILTQGFQQPELQVRTGTVGSNYCAGSTLSVPFTASGIISASNIFTAELSSATGSFASPVSIGSITGNVNGSITAIIPASSTAGTQYRIRVKSTLPTFIGPDNGVPITVNRLQATIPVASALSTGVVPFTVYYGYSPASTLTLHAVPSTGTAPFTYVWSTGATTSGINVVASLPVGTRNFNVTITDALGCKTTLTQSVQVTDVRCGKKLENITVCTYSKGIYSSNCISSSSVGLTLLFGAQLGPCSNNALTKNKASIKQEKAVQAFMVKAFPNPSPSAFTLLFSSGSEKSLQLNVIDALGRTIEKRINLSPNGRLVIGKNFRPGIYFVEVIQGQEKMVIKLVKQSD